MKICKDCEMEVDKLNLDGICHQCYIRKTNNVYLNKKNGTNNPYIPLKDIKGTIEYNRVMGRRRATLEKKNNKSQVTVTKTTYKIMNENKSGLTGCKDNNIIETIDDKVNKYRNEVVSDIKASFAKNNINDEYLKFKNINEFVENFFSLLQEDNFIMDAKKADEIFFNLKIDYDHLLENTPFEDLEGMQRCNFLLKILLDLRRPTKEILDYYYVIDSVIDYLRKDKEFVRLLDEARIKLKQKSENHKDIGYYVRESNIVSKEDFVLGERVDKYKLYDATVWCYNLHGNPNKSFFRAKGGVKASTPEQAKLKFKTFLKEKFYSVTYKDEDIKIEEVTQEELDRRTKGCL